MKRTASHVAFPVTLVVVMAAFLAAMIFAGASQSLAASGHKKSSTVAGTSAVAHTEAMIKQLQGALKITEAQQELWNNLTLVMRENAKDMDTLTKDRPESIKMNAVEHMKFHNQNTQAHLDQQKKFIPPFEALYASMTDEQKKSTDTIFRTGRLGGHKRK